MAKNSTNKTEISTPQDHLTDMIRKKAYELYAKNGKKPGHDMDNWLEAERLVKKDEF